jgi:uncharacterized phage protein gp47/JayE
MAGLTVNGFVTKTASEIRDDINDSLRGSFGPSVDVSDGSVLGQLAAILASLYAELWEVAEAVNASQDPDAATGARLDSLAALTGTQREAASASTVTLTLTGTNATSVAAGSRVSVTSTEAEFSTDADATLATLTAWAISTAYVVGDRRTNSSRGYVCTGAGTSAGSGGPTTTASSITDGTAVWRYMGEGAAAVDVAATCTEDGPTVATSGSIITIETPVSGWSNVMNLEDADLGSDVQSDESLRISRENELARAGSSPVDALRADLLDLDSVTAVTIFVNNTDATDSDGVPPHAVEAMVTGGADQDIWDQLLASVAAGIATHGDEVGTATDTAGNDHEMKFSRAEELTIYVDIVLIKDPETYPSDGDDQIKAAIVAYGDAQVAGKDVVASRIAAACFSVDGVLDVTDVDIGTTAAPTLGTTIAVSLRQIASFDTSRITVDSTAEDVP